MSEIQTTNTESSSRHQRIRLKRSSAHIDMTPMVDLAFLLLTFFIMTTTFKNNRAIDLVMPSNVPTVHPTLLPESKAFNLLITKDNKLMWYMGADDKAATAVTASLSDGPNSIRKILLSKNLLSNNSIFVMIKPTDNSTYDGLIKVIDLMSVCNIASYTIMDLTDNDKKIAAL